MAAYTSPEFLPRPRDGLVIPPQQKPRAVQAECLEVRYRIQLRRGGCQSRGEFEGEEICPWRWRLPGTGLHYQSSLPDAQQLQPREAPTASISPRGILIVVLVVSFIIFAMSSKPTTKSVPVAPVPHVAAPDAAPAAPKHIVKHKRKHAVHRVPVMTPKPDGASKAEPASAEAAIPSS